MAREIERDSGKVNRRAITISIEVEALGQPIVFLTYVAVSVLFVEFSLITMVSDVVFEVDYLSMTRNQGKVRVRPFTPFAHQVVRGMRRTRDADLLSEL